MPLHKPVAFAGIVALCLCGAGAWGLTTAQRLTVLWERADAQYAKGDLAAALQTAQDAVKLAPDNGVAWAFLGWVQLQSGDWDAAEKSYKEALRRSPHSGHVYHGLGMLLYERGRLAEAENVFSEGLKADPAYAPLHCALGFLAAIDGRSEEALSRLQEGLARATTDGMRAEARNLLAYEYAYQGNLPEAIRQVRLAISLRPNDPYYRDSLAALAALSGQYAQAEAQARKTLAMRGAPAATTAVLAFCLAAQGKPQEARAALAPVLQQASPTGDGVKFDLVYFAIRTYLELGECVPAKLLYQPLAARYPRHPWLTALRGKIGAIP